MLTYIPIDFDPFEGHVFEKAVATNEPQRELWLSCMLGGDDASLAYNESVSLELNGPFNEAAFDQAIADLIDRHEALRASLSQNGEYLLIARSLPSGIFKTDLSDMDKEKKMTEIHSFIRDEMAKPFDLYHGPLFRFYLHKLDEEQHYFTLIIHHLVGDGWSLGIILEDLSNFYNARTRREQPKLPPAEQISDYAEQQAVFNEGEAYRDTLAFWLDCYKDGVPVINFPLDFNRPSVRTYRGGRNDYTLDDQLLIDLKKLAAQAGSSLVATLITAFEVFLYHRTGQTDLVLGLPSAGQAASGNFRLVGHCVHLLPLKSTVTPDSTFLDHLKKRKSGIYDAYDHQRLTFSELLNKLNLKRDVARVPLVPIVFNVDMGMDEKVAFSGLKHQLTSNPRVCQTFEISLNINGSKDAMVFEWAYNTQLFSSGTIDRLMQEFGLLLRTVTSDPTVLIKHSLLHPHPFPAFADYQVNLPADKTFIDIFEEQALKNPMNTALVFEGKSLSYEQLDQQANRIAAYLAGKGIKAESLVAMCLRPSLEMIVALLGIMKSGSAYVPIDPEFPKQRKEFIIGQTHATVVLSERFLAEELKDSCGAAELVCLDDNQHPLWDLPPTRPNVIVDPKNLAYIIYTSGSTGNPKGVMITHWSMVDYLFGLKEHVPVFEQCERYALGSSIATDLGNTIVYGALANGAELHLFAKDRFNDAGYIHAYFAEQQIDCLKIVPSHWRFLSLAGKNLFPKKLLMFGGETLPATFVKEVADAGAACLLVNHYGPTETTIGKLLHVVKKEAAYASSVPIGKPFSNTRIYVFDKGVNHAPIGVPGELYIGGAGLSRGYLHNKALTERSFIPDPHTDDHALIYKTGDLVRWLPDGNIEYLGRLDDQIKIRGNRIELGEIQNALQKYPGLRQCAILVDEVSGQEKRLVAYLVLEGGFNRDALIDFLKRSLPEYMIPRILIPVTEIPLTANGKIDRKALPEPENPRESEDYVMILPSTPEEKMLAEIWQESLGVPEISIKDDFFELGGHSLIAVKVMTALEKRTGKRLPLASLFDNPNIEKLAKLINSDQKLKWDALVPIKTTGTKTPVYLVHGGGLNVLLFKNLAKFMDEDQPVYALQALGLGGETTLLQTIEDIAAKYISEMLEVNPEGPYLIAGYSLGGKIAYEMARQLMEKGKKVDMLGIFDTYTGSTAAGSEKFREKITRQFRKLPFFLRSFFRNPSETIHYQFHITKRKLKQFFPHEYAVDAEFFSWDKAINQAYESAYKTYQLTPMDIGIDLFRVKKRIYYLDDMVYLGWNRYAKKGINVHVVPGDHKTFLYPPHDHDLARILQARLNQLN